MFDLRHLHLEPGDHRQQAIEVRIDPITLGGLIYEAQPPQPTAELEVTRLRSGILFGLQFETTVHGACHRCLEDAAIELAIEAEEYQADDPESAEDEVCEYYHPAEGQLDTDLWASNAVVLSLPTRILCRVDCAGLCPTCGANLNEGPCGCTHERTDHRWAALAELRLRDE
jgi:uncharacterized protein